MKIFNQEPKIKNHEKQNDKINQLKLKNEDKIQNLEFNNALSKQCPFENHDYKSNKDIKVKLKDKKEDNRNQKIQVKRNSIMNKLRERNNYDEIKNYYDQANEEKIKDKLYNNKKDRE